MTVTFTRPSEDSYSPQKSFCSLIVRAVLGRFWTDSASKLLSGFAQGVALRYFTSGVPNPS